MTSRSTKIGSDGSWWYVYFSILDHTEVAARLFAELGQSSSLHWKLRDYRIAKIASYVAFRKEEDAILFHLIFA